MLEKNNIMNVLYINYFILGNSLSWFVALCLSDI